MWVNPKAHCASCVPSTGYVGKLEVTQKLCIWDLAVSTACKSIVLNE